MKKIIKAVDDLVYKCHYDRENSLHLGFSIIKDCIEIAAKNIPIIERSDNFKIGSEVAIKDSVASELCHYKIVKFYTKNSVLAEKISNSFSNIGKHQYPTLVIPLNLLVKAKALKPHELIPIEIELGAYFKIITNNTVYKAVKIDGIYVEGKNKLTFNNAPKNIRVARTGIILVSKRDYKLQHKAEKRHPEMNPKSKVTQPTLFDNQQSVKRVKRLR